MEQNERKDMNEEDRGRHARKAEAQSTHRLVVNAANSASLVQLVPLLVSCAVSSAVVFVCVHCFTKDVGTQPVDGLCKQWANRSCWSQVGTNPNAGRSTENRGPAAMMTGKATAHTTSVGLTAGGGKTVGTNNIKGGTQRQSK